MVALSVQMVLAQRLVRVICENCAVPHTLTPHEYEWLRLELGNLVDNHVYQHGQGCSHCGNTGYLGRQAVYEFLEMSNTLVEVLNRGDANEFMALGREQMGGNTLRRDAVRLVLAGRTTVEEAMRIGTQLDD
jgi:MSHA biogenesis protein MshE